jgi:hypothetical protein
VTAGLAAGRARVVPLAATYRSRGTGA